MVKIVAHDASIVFLSVGRRELAIDLESDRAGLARILGGQDPARDSDEGKRGSDLRTAVETDADTVPHFHAIGRSDRETGKVHVPQSDEAHRGGADLDANVQRQSYPAAGASLGADVSRYSSRFRGGIGAFATHEALPHLFPSTMSSNSWPLVPCGGTPASVPNAIFTPA